MILTRVFLAASLAAPIAPAPPVPQPVETQCAVEGGCVWVSQRWLRERLQEAARDAYAAGKRDADVRCGRVL